MLRPLGSTARRLQTSMTLCLLLAAGQVRGADPGKLYDARVGDGSIARGRDDSEKLDWAEVSLAPGGYAEIEVRSFRGPYRFAGSWSPAGGRQVSLRITETDGAKGADAGGWIEMAGDGFARLEIDGRNAAGGKLAVSFRATGPAAPTWQGLEASETGYGELERGDRRTSVERVQVTMRRGGEAEITLWTPQPLRLSGRWNEARGDEVRFTVSEAFNDRDASGAGTLRLAGRSFERFEIDGRSRGDRFSLDFRVGDRRPETRPERPERWEQLGINLPGNDYNRVYFATLQECQSACDRDRGCRAYTYNTRDRMCYFKDKVGRSERRSDCVSGEKERHH